MTWISSLGYLHLNKQKVYGLTVYVLCMIFFAQHYGSGSWKWFRNGIDNGTIDTCMYYEKLYLHPLEVGMNHIALFNFTLLPLTMCRTLITYIGGQAQQSSGNNGLLHAGIFNTQTMEQFHGIVGYVATIDVLCVFTSIEWYNRRLCYFCGDEAACEIVQLYPFKSDIYIAGLCIVLTCFLVLWTSYFRYGPTVVKDMTYSKNNYKLFFAFHHITFLFYFLICFHTMDSKWRNGQTRGQNFQWVGTSMLVFAVDRFLLQKIFNKYNGVRVVEWKTLGEYVHLVVRRPAGFVFQAGQYAYLHAPQLMK